jgi:uncharacterized membrane protein
MHRDDRVNLKSSSGRLSAASAVIGEPHRHDPHPAAHRGARLPGTRLAVGFFGRWPGLAIGTAYGLSSGIQQAVGFDFHEIAFAVPLLARTMELLVERRWRAAALWALPLLLVKEDQALIVTAIGVYIFCAGSRRLGALLAATGVVVGILTVEVVIPLFNTAHTYLYADVAAPGGNPLHRLIHPATKEETLLVLLMPTLFIAVRSPLILIGVPTLLSRFWATTPNYWGIYFQYDAVLVPILFVAFVEALRRLRVNATADAVIALCVALTLTIALHQPLLQLRHRAYWRLPSWNGAAESVLHRIPNDSDVVASDRLAPQLTDRCDVFRLTNLQASDPLPDWAVVTGDLWGQEQTDAAALPGDGYVLVAQGGGITLYRLGATP